MVISHEGNHHPPKISIGEVGGFPRRKHSELTWTFSAREQTVTSPINLQEKQCGSSARSHELLTLILYGHQDDPLRLFSRYQVRLLNMKYSGSSGAH